MATLETYLTSIADAIREKKGTSEPINAKNFASEILSIQGGGSASGASLNVAYGTTPPADTTKIWLECEEPTSVDVQNYIGNVNLSEVANYGGIDNPTTYSYFQSKYFSSCYIGNNQIAIVGLNHIRIYDLSSKSYIADYTINLGTIASYTNVIYKNNVLYFAYEKYIYIFNLETQTLNKVNKTGTSNDIGYIYFSSDTKIGILGYAGTSSNTWYIYNCDLSNGTITQVAYGSNGIFNGEGATYSNVKVGDYLYNFYYNSSNYFKFNLTTKQISAFTSWKNFVTSLGGSLFYCSTAIYDNDRYIYIIGGGYSNIGYDKIIKYDTVNDTFEMLEQKLISGKYKHFSVLVDNRVYMFGGEESGTNYGRRNQIDYFDISYPLTQNNAIITTNTINTDNNLPLINTDKLKLNSNIASAYKGNADNLAEKVNAYYYQSQKTNDTYSSITFDKNTIVSNFETITNAINNNGGVLGCAFGGDSENANYSLMATIGEEENTIALVVMNGVEYVMIGVIGSDGTLYESFGSTPCTWLDGYTNTITFDNSYELNTVYDGGLPLSTPQELIDLGVCTFGINQGGEIGYWKGINCKDYTNE